MAERWKSAFEDSNYLIGIFTTMGWEPERAAKAMVFLLVNMTDSSEFTLEILKEKIQETHSAVQMLVSERKELLQ